jgi:hypothetical protein
MQNNTTIEFAAANNPATESVPWATPKASTYQDLVLKPDYAARRLKLAPGQTWFRILPKLRESTRGWMLGIHALNYQGGRHAHPKTLRQGAKSVFDHAYQWFKTNRPEALYSKANKDGYKLLADPLTLCWVLVEEEGKMVGRLILASGYDGSRGGTSGLGSQIWQLTQERDEHGNLATHPVDPDNGVQIGIDKIQPKGSRYPSYQMRVGRVPAPIREFLARMDQGELAALRPLEQLIHVPSEDEEWGILGKIIGPDTVDLIRSDV